jgi:hypothetical protein
MLYRSTDRLCRRGAAMQNLSHSASLQVWENNAPSKSGIKHLEHAAKGWKRFFAKAAFDQIESI